MGKDYYKILGKKIEIVKKWFFLQSFVSFRCNQRRLWWWD